MPQLPPRPIADTIERASAYAVTQSINHVSLQLATALTNLSTAEKNRVLLALHQQIADQLTALETDTHT